VHKTGQEGSMHPFSTEQKEIIIFLFFQLKVPLKEKMFILLPRFIRKKFFDSVG
jgi:hypothetical protein